MVKWIRSVIALLQRDKFQIFDNCWPETSVFYHVFFMNRIQQVKKVWITSAGQNYDREMLYNEIEYLFNVVVRRGGGVGGLEGVGRVFKLVKHLLTGSKLWIKNTAKGDIERLQINPIINSYIGGFSWSWCCKNCYGKCEFVWVKVTWSPF